MMYKFSQIQNKIESLEKFQYSKRLKHIKYLPDNPYSIQFLQGDKSTYKPSKSGLKFHESEKKSKFIMGPFNSGKSTICLMEILFQASNMPICHDGIRRARFACIRNTHPQLYLSIFKTWENWLKDLGTVKVRQKPVFEITHQYNDGKGWINLELLLLACDKDVDLVKFKSTEFTGIYLNELNEFGPNSISFFDGRSGRYPPIKFFETDSNGNYPTIPKILIGDTNPPDTDHWLYHLLEENEMPEDFLFVKQPPGLLPDGEKWKKNEQCDNYIYLPNKNYYLDTARFATKEYIKVYCLGEYGFIKTGKIVYEQYNDDIHAQDELMIIKNEPFYFGWDLGLNPAFICCQFVKGQLRCIKEFYASYTSLKEFLSDLVMPWINLNIKNQIYYSLCDPSDSASSANNVTCISMLEEFGIRTQKALTNNIIERIDSVKNILIKLVNGQPAFLISKRGCPILRKGFLGEYQFKRVNIFSEEKFQEIPEKKHPTSDIQDALQYICLSLGNNMSKKTKIDSKQFIDTSSYI